MPEIVGGCLCGSVRYASDVEPALQAGCHCTGCQKQTSSAFSVLVAIPKGNLRIEGPELGAFHGVGETGEPVKPRHSRRYTYPLPGWQKNAYRSGPIRSL